MKNIGILKINERAEKTPGCIRFDKGSARFPFPEEFLPLIDKVKKEIKGKYFHYPKTGGEERLKRKIAKLEAKVGRQISPENVTVTHGGMSGLFTFFSLLTKPGDEIIINQHCFEGFSLLINYFKLVHKRVNLSDIDSIKRAITKKTRVTILNSPENPTGKVYSKEEILALVELTKERRLFLLSDEVMNWIIYKENKWQGPSLENHVVVINSFSKNWFIPGIRVGWMTTSNQKYTQAFNNFLSVQSVGVNLFGQLLMAEILENIDYKKFLKKRLKILTKKRNLVKKCLSENDIACLHKVEGGMNFYINLKKNAAKLALKLLQKYGVALIPGLLFEGKPSNFARMGFGAVDEKEIIKGIKIIADLT